MLKVWIMRKILFFLKNRIMAKMGVLRLFRRIVPVLKNKIMCIFVPVLKNKIMCIFCRILKDNIIAK